MLTGSVAAQVINPTFDDWEIIQIGQPYENPIGWTTNNSTDKFGLASTPVDKEMDENGFYARISSSAHGIDATLSGHLSQMIAVDNLEQIEFDAQCDSLLQTGRCVVSVFDQQGDALLYVDTIATMSDSFSRYVLPVDAAWATTNDSIRLQFNATGGFDQWDEMEDGYSIFLIDNVSATYITGSEEIAQERDFSFYPNPTPGWIHLTSPKHMENGRIEIATFHGQIIFSEPFVNNLNLEWLTTGAYVVTVISVSRTYSSILIRH
jgi:hypothetical protein